MKMLELLAGVPQARAAVAEHSSVLWAAPDAAWDQALPKEQSPEIVVDCASRDALETLIRVAADAGDEASLAAVWGLLVALWGRFPSVSECDDARTALLTDDLGSLLATGPHPTGLRSELPLKPVGGVIVDVTRTASAEQPAGIPRVVRQLVHHWGVRPGLTYAVWEDGRLRSLDDIETARLGLPVDTEAKHVVLPIGATIVVTEVLRPEAHAEAIEAMAYSGVAKINGIGFDLAALIEPHPDATNGPFVHHLAALTFADVVVAISDASGKDFDDYFSIVSRSGRRRPEVKSLRLPEGLPGNVRADTAFVDALLSRVIGDPSWPIVFAVASLHRRKNHLALLRACERLWQEGLAFRLLVAESGGAVRSAVAAMDRLVERGRPITRMRGATDAELDAGYRVARVSVYISLAEGYGLPIAESLACGTPVVASEHGCMGELAVGGGVLTVDPRDGSSIESGLRRVLTDDALYDELALATRNRVAMPWPRYAAALGGLLGVPLDGNPNSPGSRDLGVAP